MNKDRIKRAIRPALGLLCLILGFIGLVLPVLQGILFLLIGALLLAPYVPAFNNLLDWGEQKYPKVVSKARKLVGDKK